MSKEPTLLERRNALPYREQVKQWGSHKPWGKRGSQDGFIQLKHNVEFTPADVVTNARGDITKMPFLPSKPCFARPETFLRHGRHMRTFRHALYGERETTGHQCGRCGVREACKDVVTRRLRAHPDIRAAFEKWRAEAIGVLGQDIFEDAFGRNHTIYTGTEVGTLGFLWQDFLKAVGDVGPFASCNDEELERREVAKLQKDREKTRRRVAKLRNNRRAKGLPPDDSFLDAVKDERAFRKEMLDEAAVEPGAPRSLTRLDDRGRAITADAWAAKTILEQSGKPATPGAIAKKLQSEGLYTDITEGSLRHRLRRDLERVAELEDPAQEGGPIWPPFDPLEDVYISDFDD